METGFKRIAQVPILKVRIGTWIALCFLAGGAVLAVHHVGLGATFIMFGLLIISLIGKRRDRNPGDSEDTTPR